MNFLAPAAFGFAALLPVVVLFYLLKRRRVVRLVSSTVLWQRFLAESQASAPFQRLRHNWLLVLQLLVLVLTILALSRPFFAGRVEGGRLQVVVLDGSASMQATDEAPSRFEKSRAEALRLVDTLRDTDQMVVLVAAATAEVKQSATSDKAALRRALESCAVSDSVTRLTEALRMAESLTRDNNDAEVHLFSDGGAPDLREFQGKGLRLVFHPSGQRVSNLGLVSLEVRPNPEDPSQRALFTAVANPGPELRETALELRFDDQWVENKVVTVRPGTTEPLVFLVSQPRDGVFTVRLTADDDLGVDNEASVVSRLPQTVRVHLVTRGNRYLEKALRAAGPVELTVLPDLGTPHPPCDLVVLDGVLPAVWPERNVLAIGVMNTNWFDRATPVDAPPIVDWRSTHPLLRFVNLDNVQVARATAVAAPSWAVSVVESPRTPLVLAGELGRQRVVWVGFDVLESTWPLRLSFPIFVANAVEWLDPASIQAAQLQVRAGEPLRLPLPEGVTQAEVTRPDGTRQTLPFSTGAREFVFGDTGRRGLYRVTLGTNQATFAASLLDAAETDVRPRRELDFGRFGSVQATTLRRASLELWRWIALGALGVLLFEWWFYHRRTA